MIDRRHKCPNAHSGPISWMRRRFLRAVGIVYTAFALFQGLEPFLDFSDFVAHCLVIWRQIFAAPWIWLAGVLNIMLPEYMAISISLFLFIIAFCVRAASPASTITSTMKFSVSWITSVGFFALIPIIMYLPYGDDGMITSGIVAVLLSIVWTVMLIFAYMFSTCMLYLRKVREEAPRAFDEVVPNCNFAARLSDTAWSTEWSTQFLEQHKVTWAGLSEEQRNLVRELVWTRTQLSKGQGITAAIVLVACQIPYIKNILFALYNCAQGLVYLIWHYALVAAIYVALSFVLTDEIMYVLQATGVDIAGVQFTGMKGMTTISGIGANLPLVFSMLCNCGFIYLAIVTLESSTFAWIFSFSSNEAPAFLVRNAQNILVIIFIIIILLCLNLVSQHSDVIRPWLKSAGA